MGLRRGRLQAARHLRLPLRDDQGAAGRGGPVGRRPGLRGADGAGPRGVAAGVVAYARASGGRRRGARGPRGRAPLRPRGRLRRRASWATRPPRPRPCCARPSRPTAGCSRSSRRAPSTPRAAARCRTAGSWRRRAGRARVVDVYRLGDDQALALEPLEGELGPGRERDAPAWSAPRAPGHDAQPHRHAPAARRAARAARHARAPGRLLRGPGQAALRLHPRRAALAGGAGRRGEHGRRTGSRPTTPCARSRRPATRPRRSARWRCSARSTATGCGWSRSRTCRASCAAAPTWRPPPSSASSTSPSETSSASNVRRIEALTGPAGAELFRERSEQLRELAALLRVPEHEVVRAVERLSERVKELQRKPAGGARPRRGRRARGGRRGARPACAWWWRPSTPRTPRRCSSSPTPCARSSATPPWCSAARSTAACTWWPTSRPRWSSAA